MSALAAGFLNPPLDSSRAFRIAMQAMARPGTIHIIDGPIPVGLSPAAALLLLTLADQTTPVLLRGDALQARDWLTFHTGASLAEAASASFAVGTWHDLMPLGDYPVGTPDYPDRSTTLIVEVPALANEGAVLRGPGIKDDARLTLPDVAALAHNAALYPLGLDLFLCCGDRLAALPRSTRIEEAR